MGFLPWEIRFVFPGESQLPQSRATQPMVHAGCFSVSTIQQNSNMDYRIFYVRTDFNACKYTRRFTDTLGESALKIDSRRKLPCRTEESNLHQQRAGPTLYQLSYIPTPAKPDERETRHCCMALTISASFVSAMEWKTCEPARRNEVPSTRSCFTRFTSVSIDILSVLRFQA